MSSERRYAVVIGTRPEVIKVAPVVRALRGRGAQVAIVSTGQQRDLAREMLHDLGLVADVDLDLMRDDQSPVSLTAEILVHLPEALTELAVTDVIVQGDTATAFAAAFVAYQLRLPVAHIEAGLRTGDHDNPFPEEGNRMLIGQLAATHLAPTPLARDHLLAEGIDASSIHVVGNTAIDSLLHVLAGRTKDPQRSFLLVTLHRRESFGAPLDALVAALDRFLVERPDASVVWPVHPNPGVRHLAHRRFGDHPRVELIEPQGYRSFIHLLVDARVILTDSGGVQEEAPSLGKVVLVAREATERPEGLASGSNRLVGRTEDRVFDALIEAWDEPPYVGPLPAPSPFGDGASGVAIAEILETR